MGVADPEFFGGLGEASRSFRPAGEVFEGSLESSFSGLRLLSEVEAGIERKEELGEVIAWSVLDEIPFSPIEAAVLTLLGVSL